MANKRNVRLPIPRPAVTARLQRDMLREIVDLAVETKRTRSEVIERLLAEALAARRKSKSVP